MSLTMLLSVGIFVFVMMLIGLVLTIREFSQGAPKAQAQRARSGDRNYSAELGRDALE